MNNDFSIQSPGIRTFSSSDPNNQKPPVPNPASKPVVKLLVSTQSPLFQIPNAPPLGNTERKESFTGKPPSLLIPIDSSNTLSLSSSLVKKTSEIGDTQFSPSLKSSPRKIEESPTPTLTEQYESKILEKVRSLLEKKVFLKLNEFVNSSYNKKILKELLPESKKIFQHIKTLERANKLLDNPQEKSSSKASHTGKNQDRKRAVSVGSSQEFSDFMRKTLNVLPSLPDPLFIKLSNDYAYLKCEHQLLDLYRLKLREMCKNLQIISTNLPYTSFPKKTVVERIMSIIKKTPLPIQATLNSHKSDVIQHVIAKIIKIIEHDHLEQFESTRVKSNQEYLIQNIQIRPHAMASFDDFKEKLPHQLFDIPLSNPSDVERTFKSAHILQLYINENQIPLPNTPLERFNVFLETFSHLFNQPTLFGFLAQQIGACLEIAPNQATGMFNNYSLAYAKLILMTDQERRKIKANFEEKYGQDIFEKALKYFMLSQNCLGQGITYFFTATLIEMHVEKFRNNKRGIVKPILPSHVKRNEINIHVNGKTCKIHIMRKDGLIDPKVIVTQEYSILIDTAHDTIQAPVDFNMSIECPSHLPAENEEVKNMLFDLPLLMGSLQFPPLKIPYLEPDKI